MNAIKIAFTLLVTFGTLNKVESNNLSIGNISLTGIDLTMNFIYVQCDISWENSWRTSTLENNRDAAWVFIKYRVSPSGNWNHATLYTSGHVQPSGSTITTSSDGKGVFIYKNTDGIGNNVWAGMQLKWDYGADGVTDTETVEICVLGIEMVYIPSSSFYVGDGTTTNVQGQLSAGTGTSAFQITAESSITLGGTATTNLGSRNSAGMATADDFNGTTTRTLPAAFPKGYNAFYLMKYELTQAQYVEFLNKLTYTQQASRTTNAPNSVAGTAALNNAYRNGIDIMSPGVNPSTPAVYACNLNGNTTYNEAADGHFLSCNQIGWNDLAAYLDWAALRPYTELEFEKAARGNQTPVANEQAWGNTTITCATAVTSSGLTNEVASVGTARCNCNNTLGVIRAGCFAKTGSTRSTAGASYYGVLDLSGNVYEAVITIGNTDGRLFSGMHGNGIINTTGFADVTGWPGTSSSGIGYRGGSWFTSSIFTRVSARPYASIVYPTRDIDFMGRGARSE